MRLVTYNIQFSRGKDGEYNIEHIVHEVSDADIIALQEGECTWQCSGLVDRAARLADIHFLLALSISRNALL